MVSPPTETVRSTVFKSVQCDGLDHEESTDLVEVDIAEGQVVIDDRVQITAEAIMMVCEGRHSDKRVKVTYRDHGTEHTLYLRDCGLRGRVNGNRRLYSVLHDALICHSDDA